MEGAAHLQGQAALGPGGLGQLCGPGHSGLVTADDQLAGAVVVADLGYAAGFGFGPGAAIGQRFPAQPKHGAHAAGAALHGLGHGLTTEGGQLHGLLRGEHPGGLQRTVLAQAQACGVSGGKARLAQQGGNAAGKGHQRGLGVLGLVQQALGVLKAEGFQIKIQLGGIKGGPENRAGLVQVPAHAGALAALAGV